MKDSFFRLVLCMAAGIFITSCGDSVLNRDKHETKLMDNESKIDRIVSRMTLEEKIEMLHGDHYFTSAGVRNQNIADMVYADGPFGIREEMEPYSWNPLHLSNDSATFFPTGSALAATWSPEIAYSYGVGMAREARLRGKDMILGPAINIQRIPTGGRTYEYLSEDPFLSSRLTVGYVNGVQDNGVAVCVKHFALNNQETNRGTVNVIVSPRAMREIYLPAFEAAVVEADAYGIMAAYNKINGSWCAENPALLTDILRKDWGFKGMVISDWGGTHSTVGSVNAGLNVEMPTKDFMGQALIDSVKAGIVSEKVIDQRVREILRVRLLIEPIPEEKATSEMTAKPEQARIAYDVATKSVVLLKNEGNILPLDINKIKTIAVIGDNADKKMSNGGVGAGVKALYEVTPLAGLRNRVGDKINIIYAQGYSTNSGRRMGGWPGFVPRQQNVDNSAEMIKEAVVAANKADVVIFCGGTNRQWETEGSDRRDISLPYNQEAVIKAVAQVNPNLIFVNVSGAPVDLDVVDNNASAIIQSWFNGTEGGNALADILLGHISPSGKLPFSYPFKLEDSPAYALKNFPQTDAEIGQDVFVSLTRNQNAQNGSSNRTTAVYSEDLLVGYRWFTTKNLPVRYPFGYGLSYANFDYYDISTSKESYYDGENIEVSFVLKNEGSIDADEVAQLYVHRIDAKVEWPYQELKAFQRVTVKAGQEQSVNLSVPVEQLKYWNEDLHNWQLEHGDIELLVGSSSGDIRLKATVSI